MSKLHPYTDHEDVKMKISVLTLDGYDLDWFLEFPYNTFDSL